MARQNGNGSVMSPLIRINLIMIRNSFPLSLVIAKAKISAIIFLGIFSVLLLHQVLPHVHHGHGEIEGAIVKIEGHHHHNDNTHHHHDKKKNESFDLLGFLLGNHSHSIDVNTVPVVKSIVKKTASKNHLSHEVTYLLQIHFLPHIDEIKCAYGHAPPDLSQIIYLNTYSLRGPPLG